MKQLKLLFTVLFLTLLGLGNVWGDETATLTLDKLGASLGSTSNTTMSTISITATGTENAYTLNYLQGKKQSDAILLAKSTGAFIANATAMPGDIKSVTVYINSGAAGKATYHCAFSTTACTEAITTGSTAVNITGGNSNKYACSTTGCKYFCISLGNANNGQVLKVDVEYFTGSSTETTVSAVQMPPACEFVGSKEITMNCETESASIYYTLDGNDPTTSSTLYTGAFTLTETTTVKAIAIKDGMTNSAIASVTYTKIPEFASLAELVAADLTTGTTVKVSFENIAIKDFYVSGSYRNGIYFDIQKGGKDIEIYYQNVPSEWVVKGTVSGTMTCEWKNYNGTWELAPARDTWDWNNLTYSAPSATLTSIAISGTATKTEYIAGDTFDKAGLVVTATYSDASTLDVTSSAQWAFNPATLALGTTTVNVTATFNEVSSEAFPVAITVAPAPLKVTWDLSKDETASASADALSWTSAYATMNEAKGSTAANNYYPGTAGKTYTSTRFYQNSVLTVTPVEGYAIDRVEFTATTNAYATTLQSSTWTNASASVSNTLVTVTPTDDETAISAKIGGTCGFTSVVVYYHAGATKYNVVENLNGCSADEDNAKKFVDGTDELTLHYTLTEGYIWPENIIVKVGETVLSAEQYTWSTENAAGTLVIAYEMHNDLTITITATAKEVASIAVKTAPEKVAYYAGDNFDPAGLVITATYNDESTADIAYADAAADFSFAPALDAALALGNENVVITYNGKTCNQAISVTKAPLQANWVANAQGYANGDAIEASAIKHETTTVATVTFAKATGNTPPAYYTTGASARAYGGNTFTVAALKGFTMKKIVLSFATGEDKNTITADGGTYTDGEWTGSATAVTFTVGGTSGHRRIAGITVYYEGELATPTGIVLNTETVKKEFAFGEEFNSDNLVVKAVYSDESEEDVTLAAEVVAPNMESAGEKTVTVNYLTFSANYTITIAEPTVATSIELSETSISVREDKTAKLTATVLPAEAVDKAVTWVSSDENIVTVDENGNVTPVAVGNATITAKVTSNEAIYAECAVEITAAPVTKNYYLVKDVNVLMPGDVIILGCAAKNTVAGALGENTYLASVDATFASGVASASEAIEFVLGKDGNNWTLTSTEGKLGATTDKKMTTNTSANNYVGTWTIAISATGVATITSTSSSYGKIKYNASSPRFLNYTSGQTDIEIYSTVKRETATLRENLIHGAIGTYCADKNVDYYEGATFYVPEYKTMAGEHAASVYFVEAKTLEARHAYIYVAEAEEITAIVSGDAESTAVTGEPMVGTLKDTLFSVEANYTVYIVYENELRPVVKDAKVSLAAGRAYLNMNVLSSNAPATPAPGRKRISMGVTGANTATGLDNVEGNANVQKVLVNGNIYILRGEKMFNINGQLVK